MTPRTSEENERIRESRRSQILDAARRVFARRGLAASKVSDIASEAGISHGLVYHYFRDKDEIFTAIVEQSLLGTVWVLNRAKEQPGSPWDRITCMFTMMVQGGRQSPEYLLVAVQAATSDVVSPDARELMEQYGEKIFQDVVEMIQAGQETEEVIAGDPRMLATALLACVQGLALATVTGSDDPDTLPEPDLMLRMLRV